MKILHWVLFFTGISTLPCLAQKSSLLDGRVRMYDNRVVPVEIENKRSTEKIKSDETGYFMIESKQGDTIRFVSKGLQTVNYVIGEDDLNSGRFNVIMTRQGQSLEEIVITRKDFGENFFEQDYTKKLTSLERQFNKDQTVFSAGPNYGLGITIDGLISLLSGKKKKQKRALLYEKLDIKRKAFLEEYPKELLIQDLSISPDYVDAFLYYLVAQPDFEKIKVERNEGYQLYLAQNYDDFLKFVGLN